MERDPVCGMEVDAASADLHSEYEGRMYYLCSEACKSEFDREPQKYVKAQGVA